MLFVGQVANLSRMRPNRGQGEFGQVGSLSYSRMAKLMNTKATPMQAKATEKKVSTPRSTTLSTKQRMAAAANNFA